MTYWYCFHHSKIIFISWRHHAISHIYVIYLLSCIFFLSHLSYENQLLHGVDETSENNWYRKVIVMEKYRLYVLKFSRRRQRSCVGDVQLSNNTCLFKAYPGTYYKVHMGVWGWFIDRYVLHPVCPTAIPSGHTYLFFVNNIHPCL